MTELQLGMIGLAAAAVAGVVGYNKWQEYRHRKVAESVLKPQHDDVLLERSQRQPAPEPMLPLADETPAAPWETAVERQEPMFAEPPAVDEVVEAEIPPPVYADLPAPEPEPEPVPEPVAFIPPVVETPAAAEPAPVAPPPPVRATAVEEIPVDVPAGDVPSELLDPRLEFIVAMELVEAVPARQIVQSQRDTLQRLHKPVHWIGFNEKTREWERLRSDSELPVRRLRVGLQLVNRLGPVSGGDLATFTGAMQALADELTAVADMPPSRVLDQAAEIDRFCAAVDLEIGLNLVSRGTAFPGTKIRALAEAAGMTLGLDGLFTRHDDAGRAQFCLQNYESTQFSPDSLRSLSTHGLTFLLDVPRVDHGERVFQQMAELARRFAETLNGALVDDNRQPLGEAQLDHIRREFIGKPQATMQSFGLPAGSPQALRLFS